MRKTTYSIRKYEGDDSYSWAVFSSLQTRPIVSGLSKSSARAYQTRFTKHGTGV